MDTVEQQKIAERLAQACDNAGDAAPAVERQRRRLSLGRGSRSGLLEVLERGGI